MWKQADPIMPGFLGSSSFLKSAFEDVMIVLILWGTHVRSRNMENKSLTSYLLNDGFIYILVSLRCI